MLTNTQKNKIARMFLFSGPEDPAFQTVIMDPRLEMVSYQSGDLVCSNDQFTAAIYLVLRGAVTVTAAAKGKATPLRTIASGEVFGAASLFGANQYPTEIRAKTATTLCRFPQALVEDLLAAFPRTAIRYITFLSERIRFLNGKINRFTAGSVEEKVVAYLQSEEASDQISLSRLALALDVGRASLYRVLGNLSDRGIIERVGKEICICDPVALRRVAESK